MKMTLVRKVFAKDRTLGELYLEGIGYFCDTLEPHCIDWSKEKKVAGKTAIPEGRYKVKVGWSQRRGRNVPWLKNVPHFKDIQIHTGNIPGHTRGCILVGSAENNVLVSSRVAFSCLMEKLKFENDIEIVVTHETEADKAMKEKFPWYYPKCLPNEKTTAKKGSPDSAYLGDELEKFL